MVVASVVSSNAVTSEGLQRSFDAAAEEQQLGGHSEQGAARCPVFVPEQAFEFGVVDLWGNEHLHDFATLQTEANARGKSPLYHLSSSMWKSSKYCNFFS